MTDDNFEHAPGNLWRIQYKVGSLGWALACFAYPDTKDNLLAGYARNFPCYEWRAEEVTDVDRKEIEAHPYSYC